jgi:hypothetical protein
MGIKHFFRSPFSVGVASPHGNERIDQLAQRIYESCSDAADLIVSAHHDVGDDRHLDISLTLMYGLLHLADRVALATLGNQRTEVMERLVINTAAHAIVGLSGPPISVAQKKQLVGVFVGQFNTASAAFEQYKNLTAEQDGPARGTLLWEFGKQFADATGHSMDIRYIHEGSATLIATFKALSVHDAFIAYSCGSRPMDILSSVKSLLPGSRRETATEFTHKFALSTPVTAEEVAQMRRDLGLDTGTAVKATLLLHLYGMHLALQGAAAQKLIQHTEKGEFETALLYRYLDESLKKLSFDGDPDAMYAEISVHMMDMDWEFFMNANDKNGPFWAVAKHFLRITSGKDFIDAAVMMTITARIGGGMKFTAEMFDSLYGSGYRY